jgi:hypothetical protein
VCVSVAQIKGGGGGGLGRATACPKTRGAGQGREAVGSDTRVQRPARRFQEAYTLVIGETDRNGAPPCFDERRTLL